MNSSSAALEYDNAMDDRAQLVVPAQPDAQVQRPDVKSHVPRREHVSYSGMDVCEAPSVITQVGVPPFETVASDVWHANEVSSGGFPECEKKLFSCGHTGHEVNVSV